MPYFFFFHSLLRKVICAEIGSCSTIKISTRDINELISCPKSPIQTFCTPTQPHFRIFIKDLPEINQVPIISNYKRKHVVFTTWKCTIISDSVTTVIEVLILTFPNLLLNLQTFICNWWLLASQDELQERQLRSSINVNGFSNFLLTSYGRANFMLLLGLHRILPHLHWLLVSSEHISMDSFQKTPDSHKATRLCGEP